MKNHVSNIFKMINVVGNLNNDHHPTDSPMLNLMNHYGGNCTSKVVKNEMERSCFQNAVIF